MRPDLVRRIGRGAAGTSDGGTAGVAPEAGGAAAGRGDVPADGVAAPGGQARPASLWWAGGSVCADGDEAGGE